MQTLSVKNAKLKLSRPNNLLFIFQICGCNYFPTPTSNTANPSYNFQLNPTNNGELRTQLVQSTASSGLSTVTHTPSQHREIPREAQKVEKNLCERLDTLIDASLTATNTHRAAKKGISTTFRFSSSDESLPDTEKVYRILMKFHNKPDMLEMALDKCGLTPTPELVLQVLRQCGAQGNPAFRYFEWAGKQPGYLHTGETYNLIINVMGRMNDFGRVWAIVEEMRKRDDPSLITPQTFIIIMRRFAAAKMVRKAIDVLDEMGKFGVEADEEVFRCLLDALCKHRKVREALTLFADMKLRFPPNVKNYSVLLNGLCKEGMLKDAQYLMGEMLGLGFDPDLACYNTLLDGYAKAGRIPEAFDFLNEMKKRGCAPNIVSYTSLIHALCEAQRLEEASRLFKEMRKYGCFPDVVSYTTLIGGFCKWGKLDQAYKVLDEMIQQGCAPNQMTYLFFLREHEKREELTEALELVQEMSENGCDPDLSIYNILLRLSCNLGLLDEASALWCKMEREGISADLHTYTVFIHGLLKQNNHMDACTYYKEMVGKGLVPAPQYGTLKVLLNQLLRAGKLETAVDIWDCMRKHGSHINVFAYTIWIQGLCEVGEVKEAAGYCADMIDDGLLPQATTYEKIKKGLRKLHNRRIVDEITRRLRQMIDERNLNFKSYVKEGERKEEEKRIKSKKKRK